MVECTSARSAEIGPPEIWTRFRTVSPGNRPSRSRAISPSKSLARPCASARKTLGAVPPSVPGRPSRRAASSTSAVLWSLGIAARAEAATHVLGHDVQPRRRFIHHGAHALPAIMAMPCVARPPMCILPRRCVPLRQARVPWDWTPALAPQAAWRETSGAVENAAAALPRRRIRTRSTYWPPPERRHAEHRSGCERVARLDHDGHHLLRTSKRRSIRWRPARSPPIPPRPSPGFHPRSARASRAMIGRSGCSTCFPAAPGSARVGRRAAAARSRGAGVDRDHAGPHARGGHVDAYDARVSPVVCAGRKPAVRLGVDVCGRSAAPGQQPRVFATGDMRVRRAHPFATLQPGRSRTQAAGARPWASSAQDSSNRSRAQPHTRTGGHRVGGIR